jgi:hypothetical protein
MALTDIVFTREQLQDLPDKRRRDAIRNAMPSLRQQVVAAATDGKTSCIVDLSHFVNLLNGGFGVHSHPKPYIPVFEDLYEGLIATFPDSKVEYTETWTDVRPGVREQKKGILVDWS